MRKIFFILSLLVSIQYSNSQNVNNVFCDAADLVCLANNGATSFNFTSINSCASKKLFYQFKTISTVGASIGSFTTSVSSSYKLYGPFEDLGAGCAQLNDVGISPVFTSSNSTSHTITHSVAPSSTYILEVTMSQCTGTINFSMTREATCETNLTCQDCIKSFMPTPGKYVVSAWVKKEGSAPLDTNYTTARLRVSCPSVGGSTAYFTPSGQVIDGWQRIEGVYVIPPAASNFELKLEVTSGVFLFDDIRFFPYDGSMMSYVYDPINLRLVAELDERNYAKIYEYDEEGKLIRVKKETEKGVMTIQENRENTKK